MDKLTNAEIIRMSVEFAKTAISKDENVKFDMGSHAIYTASHGAYIKGIYDVIVDLNKKG
jgi:hypothetical protein